MEEEEKKIRHTISAEETFTLAKDVFDIRTFVKNVYSNRAIIARRINIITLCVSLIYTLLYLAYTVYSSFSDKITPSQEAVIYSIIGAYALVLIVLLVFMALSARATTKSLKKFSLALSIMRLLIKIISIAMSITAIAISVMNDSSAFHVAVDIVLIIFSITSMVVQSLPMLFGGLGKFARWLISPVKIKQRFSVVVLEWYELAITGEPTKGAKTKVAKKHYDAIDTLIDGTLVPALGRKYINTIKPVTLLNLVENCPEEDRAVLEGILKSVFAYATECGYVVFNPCRDLNFEGTVEEEKKKTIKERFAGLGAKIGKKVLNKYIDSTTETED